MIIAFRLQSIQSRSLFAKAEGFPIEEFSTRNNKVVMM
jgi:hypothetical protein